MLKSNLSPLFFIGIMLVACSPSTVDDEHHIVDVRWNNKNLPIRNKKVHIAVDFLRCGRDSNSRPSELVFTRFGLCTKTKTPFRMFLRCGRDSNSRKSGVSLLTFFLIYNQLVSNFKYRPALGLFVQFLGCFTSFSKASAKVLLFFDICKFLSKKMQNLYTFVIFSAQS